MCQSAHTFLKIPNFPFRKTPAMHKELLEYLEFAETLAHDVVTKLEVSQQANTIEQKAPGDWFSAMDLELERLMRNRVKQAFPEHGFLGEEEGQSSIKDFMWIIDPIDGSMNFLRSYPHFSVSIALVHKGEPLVACVADPVRKEFFTAAQSLGAHLNGNLLRVSHTANLQDAVIGTVFPKPLALDMNLYVNRLSNVLRTVAGARRSGSMALDLAYVAAGRLDAFWAQNMGAWDAAAGVLLVREAGGAIFTLDECHWLETRAIAASNHELITPWSSLLKN
jgi:myo-inositol-1(or 4)-monophosphatase